MSALRTAGSRPGSDQFDVRVTLQELRQRNLSAVAMDVLYLLTTAFFGHLFVRGVWAAVIAAVPLVTLLYFGLKSSRAFFVTQLVVVAAAVVATFAGLVPL